MFNRRTRLIIGCLLALWLGLPAGASPGADEPSGVKKLWNRVIGRKTDSATPKVEQSGPQLRPANHPQPSVAPPEKMEGSRAQSRAVSKNDRPTVELTGLDSSLDAESFRPKTEIDQFVELALANNPTLIQARAAIDAAKGRLVQAGLYPNPNVGYVGSEIGNDGRAGQQGVSLSQEIVRGGKLRLSQAVAYHEIEQAEARADAQQLRVLNAVRAAYYRTLATERTLSYYIAVVSLRDRQQRFPWLKKPAGFDEQQQPLAEKTLNDAREMRDKGEIADAKVLPIELEVDQLRIRVENATADYVANWKQLAALVGQPDLKPSHLEGDLEEDLANLTSDESLANILAMSPEVRVADAGVRRAEDAVRRARVQPIPNVTMEAGTQYDYASRDTIVTVALSLPLPIYNRNQGNIMAAEAEVLRATREVDRVRLALTERFAGAFARFEKAHEQVARYRELLPKAQRSYDQTILSYRQLQANPSDLILVQRALVDYNVTYLQALADLHVSTAEINGLLLIDGLNGEATGPLDGVSGARE